MARGARPDWHKSVLVVDDDLDVREAMADAVQSTGRHTLQLAAGLKLGRSSPPRPSPGRVWSCSIGR